MDVGRKTTQYIVEEAVKQLVNTGLCSFKGGKKKKIYCSEWYTMLDIISLHFWELHVSVFVPSGSSHTNFFWNLTIRDYFDPSLSVNIKAKVNCFINTSFIILVQRCLGCLHTGSNWIEGNWVSYSMYVSGIHCLELVFGEGKVKWRVCCLEDLRDFKELVKF